MFYPSHIPPPFSVTHFHVKLKNTEIHFNFFSLGFMREHQARCGLAYRFVESEN